MRIEKIETLENWPAVSSSDAILRKVTILMLMAFSCKIYSICSSGFVMDVVALESSSKFRLLTSHDQKYAKLKH